MSTLIVKNGIYRHFKGNHYKVIGMAKYSETLEDLVVYQALYGDKGFWVRPVAMFLEQVEVDGIKVSRFEFISEDETKLT